MNEMNRRLQFKDFEGGIGANFEWVNAYKGIIVLEIKVEGEE